MFHLTLPGEYDVMGSALLGLPAPVIGFNHNIAWSHTVSTGSRFTFYELELNPDDKMQYIYDGEIRDIESRTVTAQNLRADGSVQTVEHTFYLSHFGPIVDLGAVSPLLAGWPNAVGTLLTYRDANLENLRGLEQWVRMGQAANLDEFKQALRSIGIPWVNTIAADRYGDALYSDISVVPNVSISKYNSCIRGLLADSVDGIRVSSPWMVPIPIASGAMTRIPPRVFSATTTCPSWRPAATAPMPTTATGWPIHGSCSTGFSPIIGKEEVYRRVSAHGIPSTQAENRLAGTDGLGCSRLQYRQYPPAQLPGNQPRRGAGSR